jgi:hypothetical protein
MGGRWNKSNMTEGVEDARKAVGLPPIKKQVLECLKCSAKFQSKGVGNRICDQCKRKSDD